MTQLVDLQEEIKRIEKEAARLARRRETLEARMKAEAEQERKLDELVENSGYKTPKALIQALMAKYGVRTAVAAAAPTGSRRRTRVTAELRDAIKQSIENGQSMNAASKEFGISYAVVVKVKKGHYDGLEAEG